jgi:YHS domain-containing protein
MAIEPVPIVLPTAAGDHLVDVDTNDVALGGFDPVAIQSEGKLVEGFRDNQFKYSGATYLFATPSNRELFASDPEKYAPMFGGFCAVALSMGQVERANPHFWNLHAGCLVMNKNEKAAMMFKQNPDMFVKKAEENWPKLLKTLGKQ